MLRRNALRAFSQCNLNSRTDMPIVGSLARRAGEASEPTSSCHASLQMKRSVMCQCESTCTAAVAARATQKQSGNNRAQNNQWLHDAVPHSHSHSQCTSPPPFPFPFPLPLPLPTPLPFPFSFHIERSQSLSLIWPALPKAIA